MKPISPVLEGYQQHEVVFAKTQSDVYLPLPALILKGEEKPVVSRWQLDDGERARIAAGADILFTQLIFDELYHPVILEVTE
jgi:alpha-beta hydrolase superfamily lysophospholipase